MNLGQGRVRLAATFVLLSISGSVSQGQAPRQPGAPVAFFDPRLATLRNASLSWELRVGPKRAVIDQVCLVPDIPTFLEAIASWDQTKWFPILIDDVPTTAKFLRAFRPSKVVRFPRKVDPIGAEALWQAATAAVGKSWSMDDTRATPGDELSTKLGPTPPGLVFSTPTSPSLAGAVALAAGHYQPLVRWDPKYDLTKVPDEGEAKRLAAELEAVVSKVTPEYHQLGDSCDFLTLAGPYPFRYNTREGAFAFDDLIGRESSTNTRWAFAGRLLGDARESVYRAMCALFLQPETALLFNTYDRNPPWNEYSMDRAAKVLANRFQVTLKAPPEARLSEWQRLVGPGNGYGLIMLNSSGGPSGWTIHGGPGQTADMPISFPSVVLTVHSFSGVDPLSIDTIAGRWLAGGAYIYFGSMNEPYLSSFRTPTLVSALIDEGLPLGAVMRQSQLEAFGQPWRLVYLGDPLYRFETKLATQTPRLPAESSFPAYTASPFAAVPRDSNSLLAWCLKTSIVRWASRNPRTDDVMQVLLGLPRLDLEPPLRPILDKMLVEILLNAGRRAELRAKLVKIPADERGPEFKLAYESTYVHDVELAVQSRDVARARRLFEEVVKSPISPELKGTLTDRLASISDSIPTMTEWRDRLQTLLRELGSAPEAESLRESLKKIEEKLPKKTAAP